MKKFLVFLLFLAVASASEVIWSQVRIKNYVPDLLKKLPLQIPASLPFRQGRITGGQEAPKNAFPYQVGLILDLAEFRSFCGGSIISDQWILTAAHCLEGALSATVYLGAHLIFDTSEERVEILVNGSNFIIHEGWDSSNARNDIGLIKMPQLINFNDKIKPILLPRQVDISNSYEGEPAVASGWGKDSDEATTVSPVLRYMETEVFSLAICRLLYFYLPSETNICTNGADGVSTCNGDSGGPLAAYEADGTPILVGATSFGSNFGCEVGFPPVFTRITSYLTWIRGHTGIPQR